MKEPVLPQQTASWPEPGNQAELVINALDVLHLLRSAGGGLLAQLGLYGKLARVEWALEKKRLFGVLTTGLLAFALFLCLLSLSIALVLALSWDTPYRILSVLCLLLAFGVSLGLAWRRFLSLQAQSQGGFLAFREELAADMALLKETMVKDKS